MGVLYCKQPNGRYCRFSTIVDCPTNWNMDKDDLKLCLIRNLGPNDEDVVHFEEFLTRTDEYSFHIYPFDEVLSRFAAANVSMEEAIKIVNEMGYNDPYWFPFVWDNDERQHVMEVWAKLFSTLSDEEIKAFFKKWDNKRFQFKVETFENDKGKKYLVDRDKYLDNYEFKIEIK